MINSVRVFHSARDHLGEATFKARQAEGRAKPLEQGIEYAWLGGPSVIGDKLPRSGSVQAKPALPVRRC